MSRSDYVIERTLQEAEHIINTRCTLRECAKKFGVGKSTIHKDLTKRLPQINKNLHYRVYLILRRNFDEKYIRGGMSTKKKFKGMLNV
jgi:putative DeoR family transcriptional regulator (stage III sporulation protein D)